MRVSAARIGMRFFDVIGRQRWACVCAVVLMMAAALVSQTASSQTASQANQRANRITQEVTSGAIVTVAGTVHPLTRRATDLGAVDSEMQLDSMTLDIGLSPAQQAELNALLAAQQDPKSPQYRQWLTQEEYGARFGLTDSDLSKVTGWLTSQGFTVKNVAPSRNAITFSGKAWQAESAFHTQLHRYLLNGETHFANATELKLPAALVAVVTNVRGLSNFRPKPRAIRKSVGPDFTSHISGGHFLAPGDWATIYDVASIYGQSCPNSVPCDGTGMHMGIVGQTYFPLIDITNFRAAAGLTAPKLNMWCISVSNGICNALTDESVTDIPEADLDVEWAGGIAKNATVDFVYTSAADTSGNGVFDALVYAITTYKVGGARLPVISMSYGACESDVAGSSFRTSMDNYFAQAAAQGQTLLNSSGDQGASCSDSAVTTVTNGVNVDWPVSSPNVTGVGGTEFNGDGTPANPVTGADSYWQYSSSADIISSAIRYIPETSWNDTAYDQSQDSTNTLSSSGGGVSTLYSLPPWQWAPSNFSGSPMRFVPDVAFSASPDHDSYLYCTQHFTSTTNPADTTGSTCLNGTFRYSDTTLSVIGGTSCSTPSFGGMLTLLVQKYGNLGNINSKLYSLASNATSYASVFHDITTGDNKQPCAAGTSSCVNGEVGYAATTGYDLVTGLGSIDGGALYAALGGNLAGTTTSISVSPTSLTIGGGTVNLSATITSSTSGSPSGTVTFKVGGTQLGQVALSSGTASLSNIAVTVANGFSAGTDLITADYGGDTTFAASSSSTGLVVIGLSTTTTVTATPNSVASGGTTTLVATVTPAAATGTVTFAVGGRTIGTAGVSGGTATSTATVSTSTGFRAGLNTITASYNGDGTYSTSNGTTPLTMTVTPSYTLGATTTTPNIGVGQAQNVTLTLTSTNYTGTVTLVASSSSANVVPTLSSSSILMTANGTAVTTLTITTTSSAANHAPAVPWKSGGAIVFAVLLGAPFTLRRRRALAVLMTAIVLSLTGFLMSCGGGGGSTVRAARVYSVTVMPTGDGTVTNPTPLVITVTVQ